MKESSKHTAFQKDKVTLLKDKREIVNMMA
jgi:hypothetical protein